MNIAREYDSTRGAKGGKKGGLEPAGGAVDEEKGVPMAGPLRGESIRGKMLGLFDDALWAE